MSDITLSVNDGIDDQKMITDDGRVIDDHDENSSDESRSYYSDDENNSNNGIEEKDVKCDDELVELSKEVLFSSIIYRLMMKRKNTQNPFHCS